MKLLGVGVSAILAALVSTSAYGSTIYAQSVVGGTANGDQFCDTPAKTTDRSDLCNSLGAPDVDGPHQDGGFTSAGNFESLLFDFGQLFTGPITIWEVTGGLNPSYIESVDFTLQNSVTGATAMGVISNNVNNQPDGQDRWQIEARVAGLFDSLLLVDSSSTSDGFDVDAVSVQIASMPVPASAAFLAAGLGAFGFMRRRKTA